jgi:hypothetical protein
VEPVTPIELAVTVAVPPELEGAVKVVLAALLVVVAVVGFTVPALVENVTSVPSGTVPLLGVNVAVIVLVPEQPTLVALAATAMPDTPAGSQSSTWKVTLLLPVSVVDWLSALFSSQSSSGSSSTCIA